MDQRRSSSARRDIRSAVTNVMPELPVYLDNHSTTRVDPRVLESMLPFFSENYGNEGSTSHPLGWAARDAVEAAQTTLAALIGATSREIVFTSGATESNNLAIFGIAGRAPAEKRHIVSVATEHRAVLDPLERLDRDGWEITLLDPESHGSPHAGRIAPEQVRAAIRDDTALVSVMWANNEMGVIQPIAQIAAICRDRGVPLHTDATQAVGRIPVDVRDADIALLSFSAHKMYGPKGIGGLYVRRRPPVRLRAQIFGGGQQGGRRSGTLNVPGIVGFAEAARLCGEEMQTEAERLQTLRRRLHEGLTAAIDDVTLNGPTLDDAGVRLPGNLNMSFGGVDGEALMMSMRDLCVSSGSACTSAEPEPSHVLRALGISDEATRSSLRFGLGRFTTEEEVDFAVECVAEAVGRLRKLTARS